MSLHRTVWKIYDLINIGFDKHRNELRLASEGHKKSNKYEVKIKL